MIQNTKGKLIKDDIDINNFSDFIVENGLAIIKSVNLVDFD
jgi:hypothetical protein